MTDSFEDRIQARVGKTLKDKWRIDGLIGVGGMAAVYACTHRNGMTERSVVGCPSTHPFRCYRSRSTSTAFFRLSLGIVLEAELLGLSRVKHASADTAFGTPRLPVPGTILVN